MKTLFDADRLDLSAAMKLTAESLREYGERYRHWAVAYSGGKDSSATLAAVVYLIEAGRVPTPASLTVLYADTRMELPPLQRAALAMLDTLSSRGASTRVVLPELDDRFMVYMLGRGVPPPKNRFRWCTSQIKVEPMLRAIESLRNTAGEKLLMLTGVRLGESAARDQRIALSCSRDGAECGQGWFQESTPESIADTLAPLLHWRTCLVWDWLMLHRRPHKGRAGNMAHGLPTETIADVYDQGAEGEAIEVGARTGCVGCNLASRDNALDRVLQRQEWAYLLPLKRLRLLYAELTEHRNRLRKGNDERRVDGSLVKNPGRIGPLTLNARRYGLAEVLGIQADVNAAARQQGRPTIDLIDAEEQARIEHLIDANTWPNKWDGSELPGDTDIPDVYADSTQNLLPFEV